MMKDIQNKHQNHRQSIRSRQVQNYKKTKRFENQLSNFKDKVWRSSQQPITENSFDFLDKPIQSQNLVELLGMVSSSSPEIRSMLSVKLPQLMEIIAERLNNPDGLFLVGNLIDQKSNFMEEINKRRIISKIASRMHTFASNSEVVEICAWTLCQLTQNLALIERQQIPTILPLIQQVLISNQECSSLLRLLSYLSKAYEISPKIILLLCSFSPTSSIKIGQIYLIICTQLKILAQAPSLQYSLTIMNYLEIWHRKVPKRIYEQQPSLYYLLWLLVEKSSEEVSVQLLLHSKLNILEVVYGSRDYYVLMETILSKVDFENSIFYELKQNDFFEEIISDLFDPNLQIVECCLRIIKTLIRQFFIAGSSNFIQQLKTLSIEEKVNEILQFRTNRLVKKEAEAILELLDHNI